MPSLLWHGAADVTMRLLGVKQASNIEAVTGVIGAKDLGVSGLATIECFLQISGSSGAVKTRWSLLDRYTVVTG
jgi:hypothetical protein